MNNYNYKKRRESGTTVPYKKKETPEKYTAGILKNIIILIIFVALLLIGSIGAAGAALLKDEKIPHGTTIDDINVGGMTHAQARAAIQANKNQRLGAINIRLDYGGDHVTFNATNLGVECDADAALQGMSHLKNENVGIRDYINVVMTPSKQGSAYYSPLKCDRKTIVEFLEKVLIPYDIKSSDAQFNFSNKVTGIEFVPEVPSRKANIGKTADVLIGFLENYGAPGADLEYTVEYTETQPQITVDKLKAVITQIGECVTQLPNDVNGIKNIETASQSVNGAEIGPGEVLSLNALIGECTMGNGYVPAPITLDGLTVPTTKADASTNKVGAGISQIAGNLYTATLLADMEIVERYPYPGKSNYLPIGLEASLIWNEKDLKIRNVSEHNIYLSAVTDTRNNLLIVRIFGYPLEGGVRIDVTNEILREIPPGQALIQFDESLPYGESKIIQTAENGYEVLVRRNYYYKGELNRSEIISQNIYKGRQEIVAVGVEPPKGDK